jgi:L-ascorbate metabolism protein UlaG (beta-lactamase superfamily)
MIVPYQSDDAFLQDVASRSDDRSESFRAWWLGQSGFLIQWQGHHLLFDPYLSDSLTRKYAATDKPHVRLTGRVMAPGRLDFIDVVTSSHNHTDHLDAETLKPLFKANPDVRLVIPEANRAFVSDRLGCDPGRPVGVDDGEDIEVGAFRFRGVAAAHNEVERDLDGRCRFLGYIVRFGPWTVYHSGDTLWHVDLAGRLAGQNIDLAFLPINGNNPERRVAGNLDGAEAVNLARKIGIEMVVPCHFEMFGFNTETPKLFLRTAEATGQSVRVLRSGESLKLAS